VWQLAALAALICAGASARATTYTGAALTDSNPTGGGISGDLRWAIAQADADGQADTINLQSGLSGTITLSASLPAIAGNLTISGPGAGKVTVSGNNLYQVF